jgi:hypothetical protein
MVKYQKNIISKYPEEAFSMANLLIVISTIFLIASAACARGFEVEKKPGEYQAEVKTDRSPSVSSHHWFSAVPGLSRMSNRNHGIKVYRSHLYRKGVKGAVD